MGIKNELSPTFFTTVILLTVMNMSVLFGMGAVTGGAMDGESRSSFSASTAPLNRACDFHRTRLGRDDNRFVLMRGILYV